MNWRHRDWLWTLTCILLLGCSLYVNHIEFMSFISYISTFVSIALAAVAIYISVREVTKSDRVKEDMNMILGEMKEKIGQLDNKVSSIDINAINQRIVTGIDEGINQIRESIVIEMTPIGKKEDEIIPYINEQLNKFSNDLKASITVNNKELSSDEMSLPTKKQQIERTIEELVTKNPKISIGNINRELHYRYGIMIDDHEMNGILRYYRR
ncbi:hypothetical protein C162_20361 [Paenibacillus sp. FSL R7-269]|uniref:hypothetical protein n=1 Tax=Paenibacillus sp. FSL R7-269 TaxID=1226755 RepID=UPI0003E1D06B|nr:hypothetical protein [Paenibacillus sp. FSL R7-269]ETT45724.1 hypothetical protein C162_20361 [Paenibacillus sp. FSL R7-269]